MPASATVVAAGTTLPWYFTTIGRPRSGWRRPTTWWATLVATSSMVSVSRTSASCVTKSSWNMALIGTGCGSAILRSSLHERPSVGRRRGVVRRPAVVVGVVAHGLGREAHPAQDALHGGRLDLPAQEPFDHGGLVLRVPVLPPDLPTDLGAEVVHVPVVGQRVAPDGVLRVVRCRRRPDREVAEVAQPRQGLGQRLLHRAVVDVGDELVPDRAELLLEVRVLLGQPLPLGLGDATLGLPPHRGPPEPHAEVERVVPGLEPVEELLPVPRLLQAVVLNGAEELVHDPLLHELLVGLLPVLKGRVVVHARAGQDRKEAGRRPEGLVDDPPRSLGGVLHEDLERRAALLGVAGAPGLGASEQF